ncbi:type I-Fv CRISPR-associated protein Cas5fv [Psychromonas sp. MME2]|uniref:type I-Fv CRISPR-associated protein Cas5fv n=1 Tax=Psychromonas sp. MME2 TaxID=3231033 RepID=UPI00339CCDF0
MRITIEYDSCWQTGFLNGNPNKPISKKENDRAFVATSKTRGEKFQPITLDTVLGVLSRLIGDQRKLYQAKNSDFYFDDIQNKINWLEHDNQSHKVEELMYLVNKSDDRCAQSSYLGVLEDDNPWFFSKNSHYLWSILFLTKHELINFILSKKMNGIGCVSCDPKSLISRINAISDSKSDLGAVLKTNDRLIQEHEFIINKKCEAVEKFNNKVKINPPKTPAQESKSQSQLMKLLSELNDAKNDLKVLVNDPLANEADTKLNTVISFLSQKFPDEKKLGEEYCKNGVIYPTSLYSAALYLQAEYLLKNGHESSFLLNSKGEIQIQGFSKRGFNGVRDWLNAMTGKRKKSVESCCCK